MGKEVLITGSTGSIGRNICQILKRQEVPFKAASREVDNAKQILGKGVNVVEFDFDDPETFEDALDNVDRIFLLGPPMALNLDQLLMPFVTFAEKNNVNRIVYLSAFKSEKLTGKLNFHVKMEDNLKEGSFQYTILKPSFFSQNFKNYEYENIMERGVTYVPAGSGKAAFIDVRDIAEVAVETLTSDGHLQKSYDLTGPQSLSYYDAAEILSEVLGKKITYPEPSPKEYAKTLIEAGMPEFMADYMNGIYGLIRNDQVDHVSPEVNNILGKEPIDLKTSLKDAFKK